VLKRRGVGERESELGADFGSFVLPSDNLALGPQYLNVSGIAAKMFRNLHRSQLSFRFPIDLLAARWKCFLGIIYTARRGDE